MENKSAFSDMSVQSFGLPPLLVLSPMDVQEQLMGNPRKEMA